jgi:Icc-related predicted phosphoesterase
MINKYLNSYQESPNDPVASETLRIAALGDLHVGSSGEQEDIVRSLLEQVDCECDVLLLAGDLTDRGTVAQAERLVQIANQVIPEETRVVAVLGNHDYFANQAGRITALLESHGWILLDHESTSFTWHGSTVGIVGGKGAGGGFIGSVLSHLGEPELQRYVRACVECARRYGVAVAQIAGADIRLALMHYSPTRETIANESAELFAVLGTDYLSVHIDRLAPQLAIHGHAHRGPSRGATRGGVPVANVASPLCEGKLPKFEILPSPPGLPRRWRDPIRRQDE